MIYSCVYSHDIIQKGEFNFGGFSYSNQATRVQENSHQPSRNYITKLVNNFNNRKRSERRAKSERNFVFWCFFFRVGFLFLFCRSGDVFLFAVFCFSFFVFISVETSLLVLWKTFWIYFLVEGFLVMWLWQMVGDAIIYNSKLKLFSQGMGQDLWGNRVIWGRRIFFGTKGERRLFLTIKRQLRNFPKPGLYPVDFYWA